MYKIGNTPDKTRYGHPLNSHRRGNTICILFKTTGSHPSQAIHPLQNVITVPTRKHVSLFTHQQNRKGKKEDGDKQVIACCYSQKPMSQAPTRTTSTKQIQWATMTHIDKTYAIVTQRTRLVDAGPMSNHHMHTI